MKQRGLHGHEGELSVKEPPSEGGYSCVSLHGKGRLCDEDLLAIVLAVSAKQTEKARALAARVLGYCGGLAGLARTTREQLIKIKGIDRVRAERILAAVEISKRVQETSLDVGPSIRHPTDLARSILARHAHAGKEIFGVLFLDVKNRPRGYRIVSVGTLDQSLVHPREVFRDAIAENASKVIFFHNHPSGDPEPSSEDVDVTKKLVQGGQMLGIPVLDHLVIGRGSYVSFKERNLL